MIDEQSAKSGFMRGEEDPYAYAVHYQSANPLAKMLINNFMHKLIELIQTVNAQKIFEVGSGEGYVAVHLANNGYFVHGGDYRAEAVQIAQNLAQQREVSGKTKFEVMDIYNYDFASVTTDLVVCCEVFEHLPDPTMALERIIETNADYFLFSVPGEPFWRIMNMLRFKYLKDLGNTPGHINHWTYGGFSRFLASKLEIIKCVKPLPWNMVLCGKRKNT